MKKITLSALAAAAVAGTAFAGPTTVVTSKEFKQPCVTPCFKDQELQLDIFYSYNDASHQGNAIGSEQFVSSPQTTPISSGLLPGSTNVLNASNVFPPGSAVVRTRTTSASIPQYFNDGSGGGIGMNYFFARYFGVGVEGNWWDGCRGGYNGSVTTQDVVVPSGPVNTTNLLAAAAATNTSILVDPTTGNLLLKNKATFGNSKRSAANQLTGSLILRYPFEGPICWAPYLFGGGGGIWDGKSTGFGHVGVGVEFRVTPNIGFFTDWRWEFMSGSGGDNGFGDSSELRNLAAFAALNNSNSTTSQNLQIARNIRALRDIQGNKRNDVSMTRVGVRFVF